MSKNIYPAHKQGLRSERLVYKHYRKFRYSFIAHRFRLKFAEIDLIFVKNDVLVLIEVKTLSNSDFINAKISKVQKQRLLNAYKYFVNRYPQMQVEYHYVVVTPENDIIIFDTFLAEG